MKSLICDLLSKKISLSKFIEERQKHPEFNKEEMFNILNNHHDEDESAIVFLILYYIYKVTFIQSNPFLSFLDSIRDETDNDFTKEIKIHYLKDNVVIFQIDHLYFLVNNSEEPISVALPNNLQNNYQFCVNCNHDLYFEEQLILETYEFYIISDAK